MTRKLNAGMRMVVASHNPGKVWEINQLIAPYGLHARSAGELGLPEPDETESTFEGNAKLKAVAASIGSGLPALADDSGLEVDCLGGAPGIYSARWAGAGKDFGVAMRKVGEEITARHGWTAPGPRANFISVLCLAWPDRETLTFTGKVFGHLVWPPRGGHGFGYDPMFVADGETQTYGEMEPARKYANSHRTRAFAAFKAHSLDHIEQQTHAPKAGRDIAALSAAAASLSTQTEAAQFVARLGADLALHRAETGQPSLDAYLTAVAERLEATTSAGAPAWRTLAQALLEASHKPTGS